MKLEVKNLTKNYGTKEVLKNINFTFEEGKIYGLVGRNGSGKTTFFNCLNDDVDINKGEFFLDGERLKVEDIGYVTATPIVPEFLTGKEFLKFYLDINEDKLVERKSLEEYFEIVKISKEDQNKLLKEYSHGMKNKIQILVNIILNPKVILLDEPLTSLDIVVQEDLKKLLREWKKNHIIIFSTHILELAMDLCDEMIVLSNKQLEEVKKENLTMKNYKEKIIQELKDDKSVS